MNKEDNEMGDVTWIKSTWRILIGNEDYIDADIRNFIDWRNYDTTKSVDNFFTIILRENMKDSPCRLLAVIKGKYEMSPNKNGLMVMKLNGDNKFHKKVIDSINLSIEEDWARSSDRRGLYSLYDHIHYATRSLMSCKWNTDEECLEYFRKAVGESCMTVKELIAERQKYDDCSKGE
jgi:hypothetical protein